MKIGWSRVIIPTRDDNCTRTGYWILLAERVHVRRLIRTLRFRSCKKAGKGEVRYIMDMRLFALFVADWINNGGL
jgi:hypothetical protein